MYIIRRKEISMLGDNTNVDAGDNSVVYNAKNITIKQEGITEERAHDIALEVMGQALQGQVAEATDLMKNRIMQFVGFLMPILSEHPELRNKLSDPATLKALYEAQSSAALCDNSRDIELLAKLTKARLLSGNDKSQNLILNEALKIVPSIPHEALIGLNLIQVIYSFQPMGSNIDLSIRRLSEIVSTITQGNFPQGSHWIEQLDILKCGRLTSFGNWKRIDEQFSRAWDGVCCVGIEYESTQYKDIMNKIQDYPRIQELFIPHLFNPNHYRLNLNNTKHTAHLRKPIILDNGNLFFTTLSETELKIIDEICGHYSNDNRLRKSVTERFMDYLKKDVALNDLINWHTSLKMCFQTSEIGHRICNSLFEELGFMR